MNKRKKYEVIAPVVNQKEIEALENLTERYNKLIQPSKIARIGKKAGELIPENVKKFGNDIQMNISEKEIYRQTMDVIANGFTAVEEQAAKFSINEKNVICKVNQCNADYEITDLSEVCLARSYDLAKLVSNYKSKDTLAAVAEGGATGAIGFWGLPFNLVLSTFLYFRAVQSIAMFYGYDVKNDSAELVIASEIFTNALSPAQSTIDNEVSGIIEKILVMSQAAVVKQTAKKTWTDMAARGGIPLLITQMRALAHKSAQKALENVGAKGLENSLFKEAFEQVGRKLTLKAVGKAVPVVSAVVGAMIDTAQMKKVLEYADIFYQKRYILEKENRINNLLGENDVVVVDADVVEEVEI